MCVYFYTKVQVSSIVLTRFRQGGNFTPTSKQTPKSPPRLGLKRMVENTINMFF